MYDNHEADDDKNFWKSGNSANDENYDIGDRSAYMMLENLHTCYFVFASACVHV